MRVPQANVQLSLTQTYEGRESDMHQMRLSRRGILGMLLAAPYAAEAAPVVNRLARIVVGSQPGGGTDLVARLLAEQLTGRYASQLIVENRPGASSRLGVEAVKAAAPDGATILQTPMPVLTLFPHVFPKTTRYDPFVDLIPVTTIGELAYGLMVRADHPARDLAGFIDWASRPAGATFSPPVLGAPQHMLALALARRTGLTLTVVPYRGGALALQDLLGGRIDSFMSHMAELAPTLRAGQTRVLAVSAAARLATLPEVPTFAEAGFPELTASEAFCLALPARTPTVFVDALYAAVEMAVAEPAVRERLVRLEMTPLVLTPAATAARIRTEFDAWGPIVRASGFNAEE